MQETKTFIDSCGREETVTIVDGTQYVEYQGFINPYNSPAMFVVDLKTQHPRDVILPHDNAEGTSPIVFNTARYLPPDIDPNIARLKVNKLGPDHDHLIPVVVSMHFGILEKGEKG